MRVRIKVCGITRAEDARRAVECGADAIGFNFVPESPRWIEPEAARRIGAALPPLVVRVAVFANRTAAEMTAVTRAAEAGVAQLHGDELREAGAALAIPWYKAFRVGPGFDEQIVPGYGQPCALLDARDEKRLGGTGQTFDWSLARRVGAQTRVILAGGLDPDNVIEAIRAARPWAVDVNSGIESAPGIKDAARLELFCRRVAEASEQLASRAGGDPAGGAGDQRP